MKTVRCFIQPDASLGGYLDKHDRPPAFTGSDGAYYSVDLIEDDDGVGLLFVRWSDDGAQPVGHVESPVLVSSRDQALALSLQDVKDALDSAIEARKTLPPDW